MKRKMVIRIMALVLAGVLAFGSNVMEVRADDSPQIEKDLRPIKDAVCEKMGEDTIVGAACTKDELSRNAIQELIEHHFNAVTFGNELKPDALFGYSNGKVPGTHEDELNGKTIVVPNMDFSRAEYMCDIIKKWNDENPDNIIKIRGHVLVWHSQTPEWFFHVDYDKSKDYVSPEEMNVRLEWYIREVLTHFTGEDSKYKGMFYGWDVVNEAISDGSHSYRSDSENPSESLLKDTHGSNSSWWHVYESNEFIINAFRFANKYAPKDLDLYYNDYNDDSIPKQIGIVNLINAVKEADGTRIDGMGMQGHYNSTKMNEGDFEICAKKYLETGVKVMITEWDMKASDSYDADDEKSVVTEYTREANRYKTLYNKMLDLKAEGYDIAGFTFWGTIDKFSWLQTTSGMGGGSTSGKPHCPLLFDDDYKAKPAYWAFVDDSHILDMMNEYKAKAKAEEEKETEASVEEVNDTSVEAVSSEEADEAVSEEAILLEDDLKAGEEKPHRRSTPMIIATCAVLAAIVLAASIFAQKRAEKRGPKKKKD